MAPHYMVALQRSEISITYVLRDTYSLDAHTKSAVGLYTYAADAKRALHARRASDEPLVLNFTRARLNASRPELV